MSYVHAWVEAANKIRDKKAKVSVPATAQLVGVWENEDGVEMQPGSNTVIRRTRYNFDFESLGPRAASDANSENQGPSGKREDFIIQGYVYFIGLGQWAVEYMGRNHG